MSAFILKICTAVELLYIYENKHTKMTMPMTKRAVLHVYWVFFAQKNTPSDAYLKYTYKEVQLCTKSHEMQINMYVAKNLHIRLSKVK